MAVTSSCQALQRQPVIEGDQVYVNATADLNHGGSKTVRASMENPPPQLAHGDERCLSRDLLNGTQVFIVEQFVLVRLKTKNKQVMAGKRRRLRHQFLTGG